MLCGGAASSAQRSAHNHWHFELPTGHIVDLGCLVHDLVHRQRDEIAEHDIDDGTHARHSSTHAHASDAGFRNRRINDTRGTKLFNQACKHFEWRASLGYIFAHDKYTRVAPQFFG